jgi:hypothetical protein
VLIALVFLAASLPAPVLIGLDLARHLPCVSSQDCPPDMAEVYGNPLMHLLATPVDQVVAQFATVIAVALPAIFGIVCYQIDFTKTPPAATSNLNGLGKAATIVLIVSAVLSVIVILLFGFDFDAINGLSDDSLVTKSAKAAFTGILSFQFVYLLKLLGIRNEPKGN